MFSKSPLDRGPKRMPAQRDLSRQLVMVMFLAGRSFTLVVIAIASSPQSRWQSEIETFWQLSRSKPSCLSFWIRTFRREISLLFFRCMHHAPQRYSDTSLTEIWLQVSNRISMGPLFRRPLRRRPATAE